MAQRNVTIRLGVENAEVVRRALEQLGTEGDRALGQINRSMKPANAGLKALNGAVKEGEQVLRSYARQAGPLGAVLESMGRGGLVAAGAVGALSIAALKLGGTAEVWAKARNQVKAYTASAEETEQVMGAVLDIAQRTRTEFAESITLWQRMKQANSELNLEQADLLRIMTTVNKAVTLSSASSDSARAALLQLGQGLAAGTLRAEEFNSIIEQTPVLAQAIARGMGVGVGALRQMVLAGEVSSEKLAQALLTASAGVDTQYAKMDVTVGQAATVVGNSIGAIVDDLNQASGGTRILAVEMNRLADGLDRLRQLGGDADVQRVLQALATSGKLAFGGAAGVGANIARSAGFRPPRQTSDAVDALGSRLVGQYGPGDIEDLLAQATGGRPQIFAPSVTPDVIRQALGQASGPQMMLPPEAIAAQQARAAADFEADAAAFGVQLTGEAEAAAFAQVVREAAAEMRDLQEEIGPAFQGIRAGELALAEARDKVRLATMSSDQVEVERLRQEQLKARVQADIARATPEQLRALTDLQKEEMALLVARQAQAASDKDFAKAKAKSDKDTAAAASQHAKEQGELRDKFHATSMIVSQVNPKLGALTSILGNLATDDMGIAAVSGLGLAVNHFAAEARKAAQDLQEAKNALKTAAREAGPVARELVQQLDPDAYQASLARVSKQISDWFDGLRFGGRGIADSVGLIFNQIELLESAGKSLTSRHAEDLGIYEIAGANAETLTDDLANLGLSLGDAVSNVLLAEGAFDDLAASSKAVATQVRAQSALAEIALRKEFVGEFERAGSDPNARAEVLERFQRTLAAELGAIPAEIRRASLGGTGATGGAARPAGGGDSGAGGGTSGTDAQGADAVILTATDLSGFKITRWDQMIDFQVDALTKIDQKWSDALRMARSTLADFGLTTYRDVLPIDDLSAFDVEARRVFRLIPRTLTEWTELLTGTASGVTWPGAVPLEALRVMQLMPHRLAAWNELLAGQTSVDWPAALDVSALRIMRLLPHSLTGWGELLSGQANGAGVGWPAAVPVQARQVMTLMPHTLGVWSELLAGQANGPNLNWPAAVPLEALRVLRLLPHSLTTWNELLAGQTSVDWPAALDVQASQLMRLLPRSLTGWHELLAGQANGTGLSWPAAVPVEARQVLQIKPRAISMWSEFFGGAVNQDTISMPNPVPVHVASIVRPTGSIGLDDWSTIFNTSDATKIVTHLRDLIQPILPAAGDRIPVAWESLFQVIGAPGGADPGPGPQGLPDLNPGGDIVPAGKPTGPLKSVSLSNAAGALQTGGDDRLRAYVDSLSPGPASDLERSNLLSLLRVGGKNTGLTTWLQGQGWVINARQGLDRVPGGVNDPYAAILHGQEMVLNASEAEAYRARQTNLSDRVTVGSPRSVNVNSLVRLTGLIDISSRIDWGPFDSRVQDLVRNGLRTGGIPFSPLDNPPPSVTRAWS